ncbi:hypothetical protein [Curtobacterium sp. B18]|uniref:hypothetical protein n=1 Tax=Curtobacterium sp. B18 TaxID=95614 RepID=UPI0003B33A94|nr:hypothetical protein [Curtobacterium sp. B18]
MRQDAEPADRHLGVDAGPGSDATADLVDRSDPVDPVDLADLDPEDAFGHTAVPDASRDDTVWPDGDGDEDDIDV